MRPLFFLAFVALLPLLTSACSSSEVTPSTTDGSSASRARVPAVIHCPPDGDAAGARRLAACDRPATPPSTGGDRS
ncbi:MAG: hypothetical protein PHP86_02335 [Nevskiales bacterium]|nr:hypothetical protein [Nevskiales bacterium]